MAGFTPPDETTGAVPVTDVTVPTLIEPPKLVDVPFIVIEELVNWLLPIPPKVPPSVKEPLVVTVPVSVMPLTVPVPLTDVTVPVPYGKAGISAVVKALNVGVAADPLDGPANI